MNAINPAGVSATNLSASVGDKRLLSDVSVEARAGRVTGLIGPNGAGKSTLLAALAGDLPLDTGTVTLTGSDGQAVDPYATPARKLSRTRAVMLQDVSVTFSFLVRDVVEMGRHPWVDKDPAIVDEAMAAAEVTHLQDRDVMTLSGGERARVALARVLAQRAPVNFFDEPTAAMDIRYQEQTLGLLRGLAANGAAVMVVLHDLSAAAAYCDDIVLIANGRVIAAGPTREQLQPEVLSRAYDWPIGIVDSPVVTGIAPASTRPEPVIVVPQRVADKK